MKRHTTNTTAPAEPPPELHAALLTLLGQGNVRIEAKLNDGPGGPVTVCAWGMERRTGACTWHTVGDTVQAALIRAVRKLKA